jgi:ABC-type transport system involved in multi-copper enzyme maturation permease subunit
LNVLETKVLTLGITNLKRKLRNRQNIFYTIGFPVMFTVIFYFMFGTQEIPSTQWTIYDFAFPGLVIYATGALTVSSAIYFANEKSKGMLERLDTMPIGRKNTFLGFIIAESLFGVVSITVMFLIGYGFMQLYFINPGALIFGLLVALLFGIQSVGIGIILAAFAKSPESANGLAMIYYIPVIFASGSIVPFDSPIVYVLPPFWAKQVYLQLTVFGDSLTDMMTNGSSYPAQAIGIPLWGGLLIVVGLTIFLLALGILFFQKKTTF